MRDPLAATRLPQEDLNRADALAERLGEDPEVSALMGKPSRAAVLRLAIKRGLAALEAEHTGRRGGRSRAA